jgi:hypothetical protein
LSRLAIHEDVPTNGASFLLGADMRTLKKSRQWRSLVTYADHRMGHTGAIYRATNWDYVGEAGGDRAYVDALGRQVATKNGPKTRTHAEMIALGYECLGRFPKHKFVKHLDETNAAFWANEDKECPLEEARHASTQLDLWGLI